MGVLSAKRICDVGFPAGPVQHLCLLWHAQWELVRGLV